MTNRELLQGFYDAFARHDGAAMAAVYAPGATFTDPAFPGLKDGEPGAMWRMLTSRAADLQLELKSVAADETTGSARWVATYTFSQTGRRVVNDVTSAFTFSGGLVATQVDTFDFHAWAGQALGLQGRLLGGTGFFKKQVNAKARAGLDAFIAGEKA